MANNKKRKYVLYAHDGSGNHGCEALARSTCELLGEKKENIILSSTRPKQDEKYGLDKICTVIDKTAQRPLNRKSINFFKAYLFLKLRKNFAYINYHTSRVADLVSRGDIALSIGGDTYCYDFTDVLIRTHKQYRFAGLKTVFWGCSIEPKLLNDPVIAKDIKGFDLITARESISYEALKKINPNTVLVCDSAFLLSKKKVSFPDGFAKNGFVGINASPLVEECEGEKNSIRQNYEKLIEYILNNTDFNIALIPHVVWEAVDDRKILGDFYEKYKSSGRIYFVEDSDCEALKGYISQCRFFIGARTHATIAAYSTCVPTLVVGYSVKARGIARDLFGTEENYVLQAQKLANENELTDAFKWLLSNEANIKQTLESKMPEYKNRIENGLEALRLL